jgi:hypothetical protein
VKLLCIDYCGEDQINGFVEIEEESCYATFRAWPGKMAMIDARFSKENYRSYRHFVLISGKFSPHSFFLKHRIQIPSLDYELLAGLYRNIPALRTSE